MARLKQTDFQYTAGLTVPLFGLATYTSNFMTAAFRRLSPFGLKPTDIKVEGLLAQPADVVVVCTIVDVGSIIKFRVSEVEIWTRNQQFVSGPNAIPLIEASLAVIGDFMQQPVAVAQQAINVASHSALEQQTDVREFIRRHVTSLVRRGDPSGLTLEPFGVTYEEANPASGIRVTADLQRSLLFPNDNAAFVRLLGIFAGEMPPNEACARFAQFLLSVLVEFGIEVGS